MMLLMVMQIATFVSRYYMPYSGSLLRVGDYLFIHRSCRNDILVLRVPPLFLLFIGKLGVQAQHIGLT